MAYSQSPVTLERMLPYLGPLTEGHTARWEAGEGAALGWSKWWAYKVREALFIAGLMKKGLVPHGAVPPATVEGLARAVERMKIEEVGPRLVQAVPARNTSDTQVLLGATPTHGLEEAGTTSSMRLGPQSAGSIQQLWHNQQPSNAPLFFPDAALEDLELEMLHTWAEARGLIIIVAGAALTLTRPSRDTRALAWSPGAAQEDRVADEAFPFS